MYLSSLWWLLENFLWAFPGWWWWYIPKGLMDRSIENRAPNKYLFKSSGIGPTTEISLARLCISYNLARGQFERVYWFVIFITPLFPNYYITDSDPDANYIARGAGCCRWCPIEDNSPQKISKAVYDLHTPRNLFKTRWCAASSWLRQFQLNRCSDLSYTYVSVC